MWQKAKSSMLDFRILAASVISIVCCSSFSWSKNSGMLCLMLTRVNQHCMVNRHKPYRKTHQTCYLWWSISSYVWCTHRTSTSIRYFSRTPSKLPTGIEWSRYSNRWTLMSFPWNCSTRSKINWLNFSTQTLSESCSVGCTPMKLFRRSVSIHLKDKNPSCLCHLISRRP